MYVKCYDRGSLWVITINSRGKEDLNLQDKSSKVENTYTLSPSSSTLWYVYLHHIHRGIVVEIY